MKIKRPSWVMLNSDKYGDLEPTTKQMDILDQWFEQYVEPVNKMLSEGIRVYSYGTQTLWRNDSANQEHLTGEEYIVSAETHKALLINIEPIKQATAEDILKEFISLEHYSTATVNELERLKKRAKDFLDKKYHGG